MCGEACTHLLWLLGVSFGSIFLEGNLAICIRSHILWHSISTSRNLFERTNLTWALMYKDIQFSIVYRSTRLKLTCQSMKDWLNQLWGNWRRRTYLLSFEYSPWFTVGWKNKTERVAKEYMWRKPIFEKLKVFIYPYMPRERSGTWCWQWCSCKWFILFFNNFLQFLFCWFIYFCSTHILWFLKSI